ncbi:MAG: hypothetical protein C0P74_011640 [Gammaproteobacteria bacterium]
MTMQSLCHAGVTVRLLSASLLCSVALAAAAADPPTNDFPTSARVEYVYRCMTQSGGELSTLYQCSCVIDEIAKQFSYDEYVEASTFSNYSSLAGERGALFRDPEEGRKKAKHFEDVQRAARKRCGVPEK